MNGPPVMQGYMNGPPVDLKTPQTSLVSNVLRVKTLSILSLKQVSRPMMNLRLQIISFTRPYGFLHTRNIALPKPYGASITITVY